MDRLVLKSLEWTLSRYTAYWAMPYMRFATFIGQSWVTPYTLKKNGLSAGHHLVIWGPFSYSPQSVQFLSRSVKYLSLFLEGRALKADLQSNSLILGGNSVPQSCFHLNWSDFSWGCLVTKARLTGVMHFGLMIYLIFLKVHSSSITPPECFWMKCQAIRAWMSV